MAEEHHIDFLFETEKSELYLWVDVDKYEKIIFNLLSNAFKYTPNGKMIKVFIHEDEETVSIGVQDQGIGIAENKKKSIFVRFENLVDRNLFNPSTYSTGPEIRVKGVRSSWEISVKKRISYLSYAVPQQLRASDDKS